MILKNLTMGGGAKKATILLEIGQSNAEGVVLLSDLPTEYQGEQQDIQIWWEGTEPNSYTGQFENMIPGTNTVNKIHRDQSTYDVAYQWAGEQKASHLLQAELNRKVYIIKNALGSQAISKWDMPSGIMWVELERFISESITWLTARNLDIDFKSAIWLQGEADVISSTPLATYESKLRAFITNWRALSPLLETTPFIMVKMQSGAVPTGGGEVWLQAINNIFQTIADEDPALYKIIDPDIIGAGGGTHYNADGYLKIGQAWFDLIK